MKYARVREGVVTAVWSSVPDVLENISNFPAMSVEDRKTWGFYTCVDIRQPLTDGKLYGVEVFTFTGDSVTWDAPVIDKPPPTQNEIDGAAVRDYPALIALKNMPPADVEAWVEANVTNLATAKSAIKTLAVAVGFLARNI
jgi:hypothetical protein